MNLSFSDEDLKFQSEFRSFIKDNYPADIKEKMDIVFDFEILPNDKYSLMILPNAIVDFYENTNDTLNLFLFNPLNADLDNSCLIFLFLDD